MSQCWHEYFIISCTCAQCGRRTAETHRAQTAQATTRILMSMIEGDALFVEENYEGAVAAYSAAIDSILPHSWVENGATWHI